MRAFLEQYGIAIFTLVITGIMVLMANGAGNYIEQLLVKEITEFTETSGLQTDKALSGNSDEEENTPKPATFGEAYAIYSEDDKSLTFMRSETEPVVGETYNGKVISNVYSDFENGYEGAPEWYWDLSGYSNWLLIEKVNVDDVIKPTNCMYFFANMSNCEELNITNLDTSNTVDTSYMFAGTGSNVENFEIIGINNLNVSNVINMERMFKSTGYNSTIFNLDLSNWDVSNVTNMKEMFLFTGYSATTWSIGNLSNWDVSNVTCMDDLFNQAGYNANIFDVGNLNNWNTSNVTSMKGMFRYTGYNASEWNVGDLSTKSVTTNKNTYTAWDTSKVTDIQYMFYSTAYKANEWNIGDITNWNTSKVEYMNNVFESAGYNADYYLNFRDKWDYSKVKTKNSFDFNVDSKIRCPWE